MTRMKTKPSNSPIFASDVIYEIPFSVFSIMLKLGHIRRAMRSFELLALGFEITSSLKGTIGFLVIIS